MSSAGLHRTFYVYKHIIWKHNGITAESCTPTLLFLAKIHWFWDQFICDHKWGAWGSRKRSEATTLLLLVSLRTQFLLARYDLISWGEIVSLQPSWLAWNWFMQFFHHHLDWDSYLTIYKGLKNQSHIIWKLILV